MSAYVSASPFFLATKHFEASYMSLHRSGELRRRVETALASLAACAGCPRDCGADRLANETGTCQTGRYARVASYFAHQGEEDCLRGWQGSGTIFFAGCGLRCVFCQNADISQQGSGFEVSPEQLAAMMLDLQNRGCHNINLVTPEHVVPQILEALLLAVDGGLRLPLVYNTSGYDSLEMLRLLDGVVDIYMPDFKLWDEGRALRYLKAKDYPAVARAALKEMQRQVGALKLDEHGLAKRGVLVRHLVLPGMLDDTRAIMRFLAAELSPDTYVNVMAQYHPANKVSAGRYAEIDRHISAREYHEAVRIARDAGIWRFDLRFLGY